MPHFQERLHAFSKLREQLQIILNQDDLKWHFLVEQQYQQNRWFIPEFTNNALQGIISMLSEENLKTIEDNYSTLINDQPKTIAVISAGNIPMAAFHDLFSVLVCGASFQGKLSQYDQLLLPFITDLLIKIHPPFKEKIVYVDRLHDFDKVIATGSNNSSRYFEYYFRNVPLLLRHNRNSMAVLLGNETMEEYLQLCQDLFLYFGLGCRSVSQLTVPKQFNFIPLIESIIEYGHFLSQHNQYLNNLDYRKTLMLMNQTPFFDAGVAIITENHSLASPIGVIHYKYYKNLEEVATQIKQNAAQIQCIVSNCSSLSVPHCPLGSTQTPSVTDFPDGIDTLRFILSEEP